MVPIGAVAHLGSEVGPSLVTLYNLYPSSTIVGGPAPGVSSGQALASDGRDREQCPTEGRRA
jgi:hydrophobic/amphiphilic exporter-1 (mainly G- bacteria), HAE1 family